VLTVVLAREQFWRHSRTSQSDDDSSLLPSFTLTLSVKPTKRDDDCIALGSVEGCFEGMATCNLLSAGVLADRRLRAASCSRV
jgi:hypothetical protein